jgi:hypothetical protein
MKQPTRLRPPTLSSRAARDHLPERFDGTFDTIDGLAEIHDSLDAITKIADPLKTPAKRAKDFAESAERAIERGRRLVKAQMDTLLNLQMATEDEAAKLAGFDRTPSNAPEIRQALRALTQKQSGRGPR